MSGQPYIPDWRRALLAANQAPRCKARRRCNRGPCHQPAIKGRTACRLHGGKGGAPRGERNGNYKHGGSTLAAMAKLREATAAMRELRALLRLLHG